MITIPVVANSFYFPFHVLHFSGVCVVLSRVCCPAEFCSPYVHSIRTWAHHAAVAAAELGAWQRRGNMGLCCPFLWSALVCTSMARADVARVKNRFSQLNATCPRWVSEFVECLMEIQEGELSVEHKVIIMKVPLVTAVGREVQDRVWRQTCPFSLCTADLQALLLSLLALTTHVEWVIMGIMESMSWGSMIPQTDFTVHSVQLLWGKHDFSPK